MKKIILISLVTALLSFSAHADDAASEQDGAFSIGSLFNDNEVKLNFGGWSEHVKADWDNYDYNEDHSGLGLEWRFFKSKNQSHSLSVAYFGMEDSFNIDSYHYGLTYTFSLNTQYELLNKIDLSLSAMMMKRGFILRDRETKEMTRIVEKTLFTPMPHLTFNMNEYISIDFMYVPSFNDYSPEHTFFIRGGLSLTKTAMYLAKQLD
ncbi:hypothetical protein LMH73_010300 [Vibrio splendidus]|nr:hypothetical protein [Vibrio splendidus]MCC4882744.1 hypothetical protein [Vibrio splendidus]